MQFIYRPEMVSGGMRHHPIATILYRDTLKNNIIRTVYKIIGHVSLIMECQCIHKPRNLHIRDPKKTSHDPR